MNMALGSLIASGTNWPAAVPAADSSASAAETSAAVLPTAESGDDFFPQEVKTSANANSIVAYNVNLSAVFIFIMFFSLLL
jgi:hypothetical protein